MHSRLILGLLAKTQVLMTMLIPNKNDNDLTYVSNVRTGDQSCQKSLSSWVENERHSTGIVVLEDQQFPFLRRSPEDPLVYAAGAELQYLSPDGKSPQRGVPTTVPRLRTCLHYCADSRPKREGNSEPFLLQHEPIENNVRDITHKFAKWATVMLVTGHVPTDELKVHGIYWYVCPPGSLSLLRDLAWYLLEQAPKGRRTCQCQRDPRVEIDITPGHLRPHHGDCWDAPRTKRAGSVVVQTTADIRDLTRTEYLQSLEAKADYLTLAIPKQRVLEHFGSSSMWEYPRVEKDEPIMACTHNSNDFTMLVSIFMLSLNAPGSKGSHIGEF